MLTSILILFQIFNLKTKNVNIVFENYKVNHLITLDSTMISIIQLQDFC